MNAQQAIENAAGKFDTPAFAILTRCEQSGVHLRVEDESLKAKGNCDTIAAWQPMIQRHRSEIIASLSGQSFTPADDAGELATLAADYQELTACILELCQLAGYSVEVQGRMLTARQYLYPFLYATECAYFRLQVIRVKAGVYLSGVEPSQTVGNAQASNDTQEARMTHSARRAA